MPQTRFSFLIRTLRAWYFRISAYIGRDLASFLHLYIYSNIILSYDNAVTFSYYSISTRSLIWVAKMFTILRWTWREDGTRLFRKSSIRTSSSNNTNFEIKTFVQTRIILILDLIFSIVQKYEKPSTTFVHTSQNAVLLPRIISFFGPMKN